MKAFVLAACLLVTVYAVDHEELQSLHTTLKECVNKLPKDGNEPKNPRITPDVLYCALAKRGLTDEDGLLNTKIRLNYCEKVSNNVDLCKTIISKCANKVNQNSEIIDKKDISLALLECDIDHGIMTLLTKLE